ncbi:hemerythrin [Chromobacterium phragmitis]|uniref:hemerythrin domain-containing protein n=1 Tax=Chromobacterium phragmitis TaxID=2202141 RepID=UPI000DECC013|nr:hemerythrin domain-containing protein [Chromobacterium phragmitis]AXE32063.1 hemerythrin [Chromobacterium phragmitis]
MKPIEFLTGQHRDCDARFSDVEQAVRGGGWAAADEAFAVFRADMEAHFRLEEERLFPSFEQASGMRAGPTAVMRAEHAQMRQLLDGMGAALAARDGDGCLAEADTLLILAQQHNMKEENILYPMCARCLPDLSALLEEAGHAA